MPEQSSIPIDILKRLSRRSIGLHITDAGLVEVRAPRYVPHFMIQRFVQSKRDWIIRAKKAVLARPKAAKQQYAEGSVFKLAGTAYRIHITDGNVVVIAGTRIFFPKKFIPRAAYHMEVWCRKFAKKLLSEKLSMYAKIMGVTYRKITIRDTSSRWGSCSRTGTISFCYKLVLADMPVIEYVVIHELAHIRHPNHQKVFWDHVGAYFPDYKHARTWLRKNGHTLKV